MDLLGDVTRKLDEIRSIQTGNQQELVALKAKLGHLHLNAIVDGAFTISPKGSQSNLKAPDAERWTELCAENEALNQVVKQHEIAIALIMDKLRVQKLVATKEIGEMRANVEEILVLQEQEISDLRLENARLKERLAKAEEVILTAFVSEETPDSE